MHCVHKTHYSDTIAAIATPPGHGGIAIIRVSGSRSVEAVAALTGTDLSLQPSHLMKLHTLYTVDRKVLDRALILVMHAPRSFTGEQTVEIHCHGGYLVARRILGALFSGCVRPANPGEFSLRAFLNGKIDLTQAEAIGDLINARNEESLRVAEEQLEGKLSREIADLQKKATDLAALFEAWVDFPEEDLGYTSFEEASKQLRILLEQVRRLADTFKDGRILHEGVCICIVGAPNVGKSSLMNALLGRDRAIVSDIPGTTRDLVEDDLIIDGVHCHIIDTAGIRDTQESLESEGIRRSRQAFSRADLVLAIVDVTRLLDDDNIQPLAEIPHEKSILVWNKTDLSTKKPVLEEIPCRNVYVSAKTGEGLEELSSAISEKIWSKGTPRRDETLITNLRHKEALDQACESLQRVIDGLAGQLSPEFIAFEMRDVLVQFGSILGTDVTEDILNSIFSRFCIGK
jgi:tRNA modification GTPase